MKHFSRILMVIVKLDQPVNQQMDIQCKLERECQHLSFEMNNVIIIRRNNFFFFYYASLNYTCCKKKIQAISMIVFLMILFTLPIQI